MPEVLACYRCGASLAALSLPLSRRDQCPECNNFLHVCRMCVHFDRGVPRQCREDGAEDVKEKERPNFCDWFKPSASAFDSQRAGQEDQARSALRALFGDGEAAGTADDDALRKAQDLFK